MNFFDQNRERSIRNIPVWILPSLLIALLVQISWHNFRPDPIAQMVDLKSPPTKEMINAMSFGDPVALSKLTMLWLQAHDNQPGISIPFKNLDYVILTQWLKRILDLDPLGQYPLLSAARVFSQVPDMERKRQVLKFVEQEFHKDPNRRWQWLAHAAFVAKHHLKNQKLALKFAESLAEKATGDNVPGWAKQMQIFLLEDMGEIESAKILLGGLLESGQVTDQNEQAFLYQRLRELEEK
ncbi:MAG: hypothetical protein AB8D52_03735 [Gammaproteobacteria bacterium]